MEPSTGYLLIDKPPNITSFHVVRHIKHLFGTSTVGHVGTLDPFATGLMIVLVNRPATKLARDLVHLTKTYHATIIFGYETDTLDDTGKIVSRNTPEDIVKEFDMNRIETLLPNLVGNQTQETPMFSSVKYHGKRLYTLARKENSVHSGITLPKRNVTIYDLKLEAVNRIQNKPSIIIITKVSSGTYIRSLSKDIGKQVGLYATVRSLRRTALGPFQIEHAKPLSAIKTNDIMPITDLDQLIRDLHNGKII